MHQIRYYQCRAYRYSWKSTSHIVLPCIATLIAAGVTDGAETITSWPQAKSDESDSSDTSDSSDKSDDSVDQSDEVSTTEQASVEKTEGTEKAAETENVTTAPEQLSGGDEHQVFTTLAAEATESGDNALVAGAGLGDASTAAAPADETLPTSAADESAETTETTTIVSVEETSTPATEVDGVTQATELQPNDLEFTTEAIEAVKTTVGDVDSVVGSKGTHAEVTDTITDETATPEVTAIADVQETETSATDVKQEAAELDASTTGDVSTEMPVTDFDTNNEQQTTAGAVVLPEAISADSTEQPSQIVNLEETSSSSHSFTSGLDDVTSGEETVLVAETTTVAVVVVVDAEKDGGKRETEYVAGESTVSTVEVTKETTMTLVDVPGNLCSVLQSITFWQVTKAIDDRPYS